MRNPLRTLDDRLVDLATALVARLAVRHGVGKYAFLTQALYAALAGFVVFLACFSLRGGEPWRIVFAVVVVGSVVVPAALLLIDCRQRDAASTKPQLAEDDALAAAYARLALMPVRLVFMALCIGAVAVAVAFGRYAPSDAWALAAGNALMAFAEYVRCVPFVPPRRTVCDGSHVLHGAAADRASLDRRGSAPSASEIAIEGAKA